MLFIYIECTIENNIPTTRNDPIFKIPFLITRQNLSLIYGNPGEKRGWHESPSTTTETPEHSNTLMNHHLGTSCGNLTESYWNGIINYLKKKTSLLKNGPANRESCRFSFLLPLSRKEINVSTHTHLYSCICKLLTSKLSI